MILLCFKVLMTTSPGAAAAATASASASASAPSSSGAMAYTHSTISQSKLDKYYKLGFDDANAGQIFGYSLPSPDEPPTSTSTYTNNNNNLHNNQFEQDLDWNDYNSDPIPPPPPTPPSKNFSQKLGFTTIMALMNIYRTGKELATGPDGTLSFPLFMVNLKLLDPMRQGFLALSVYRLVSVFFFS